MTLLVRDEEDIIETNILYHLSRGVDFIIATDNRSVDGTAAILEQYEKIGKLLYIFEPEDNYNQHEWVTRMARLAATEYRADWIIHCDADEFWWPVDGTLKGILSRIPPNIDVLKVNRHNFVATRPFVQPFWTQMRFREAMSKNSVGRPLPPKVLHRGIGDIRIKQGNHNVEGYEQSTMRTDLIDIFHFPVRTYKQIENKIVKGGAAYQRNKNLPGSAGATWRALYEQYLANGDLRAYFETVSYDAESLSSGVSSGNLVVDSRLAEYLTREWSDVEDGSPIMQLRQAL